MVLTGKVRPGYSEHLVCLKENWEFGLELYSIRGSKPECRCSSLCLKRGISLFPEIVLILGGYTLVTLT